jgi:phosphate starvation-inducible membrane PsiE
MLFENELAIADQTPGAFSRTFIIYIGLIAVLRLIEIPFRG